jgi:DNA polymerase-3 subunit gamma/tau
MIKKKLIRPITDVPAAVAVPATASPTRVSAASPASSKPEKQTEQTSEKIMRAPKSTSLKDLLGKDTKTVHPVSIVENQKVVTPFKAEDLLRCWNAFSETLGKEKIHLKNTIINCKPLLQENFQFKVVVHNPMQREELLGSSIDLLKSLRTQLKNSQIQMYIEIDETNEKQLAYTAAEKFELLNKINPLLAKLKDEFDLTTD